MDRPRYALILLLVLLPPAAALAQAALRPEAGVLLLRNGQVIGGLVTRAGDFYIVTLGETGEIRLPAADVEALCGSLDEVYEFKLRHLAGSGAKPHLDLAEWCLRQNLHSRCAQQLVAALQIEPNNEQLKHLERRLELARTPPPPPAEQPQSAAAMVGTDQLEKTLRSLPSGSVEKFAAVVQPILLNRCGANQCHGPAAKSEFRLLRPPDGQFASRRFTQRNLHATLGQLTLSNPEASPLVTLPQGRHGTALTAIFDKQSQSQLAELIAWVKMTAPPPTPVAVPATIGRANATLSQPAAGGATSSPESAAATAPRAHVMRPPLEGVPAGRAPETHGQFTPRDRYDPEIFNRRFHSK
jgi:hypothetical protein